jgi:hypothetical protein
MATGYSNLFNSDGTPKQYREPHSGVFSRVAVFAHPTSGTGSAAADVIQMIPVRKGTTVLGLWLSAEDLDTNGTPTISLDVGDGGDVDRFIDGSTVGQTGGVAVIGSGVAAAVTDGFPYAYTADDTIDVLLAAAAATKAAGNITVWGLFTMESA